MGSLRVLLAGGGTGGHLYPALNIARALRAADPTVELLFIGSERGLDSSRCTVSESGGIGVSRPRCPR